MKTYKPLRDRFFEKVEFDEGHELAGENLKVVTTVRVERVCLTCDRTRKRSYKLRLREPV